MDIKQFKGLGHMFFTDESVAMVGVKSAFFGLGSGWRGVVVIPEQQIITSYKRDPITMHIVSNKQTI